MNKLNRESKQAELRALIQGIAKRCAGQPSLTLNGTTWATADLVAAFEGEIAAYDAAEAARAAWRVALAAREGVSAKTDPAVRALKKLVAVQFGAGQEAADVLADFGLAPIRVPKITPEQRVAAVEKGRATREARHTMGPRQKARITGATPPTPSPAPLPAPLPAPPPAPDPPPATPTASIAQRDVT